MAGFTQVSSTIQLPDAKQATEAYIRLINRKLVERTLASTSSEVERSAVQAELKDHIFKAYQEKRLWTVDWDNFQLPRCPLRCRRSRRSC